MAFSSGTGPTCVLNIMLNMRGSVSSPPSFGQTRLPDASCFGSPYGLPRCGQAKPLLALLAVHQRVSEVRDMAARHPDARVRDQRRIDPTMSSRSRTIARHQASRMFRLSSTPRGP